MSRYILVTTNWANVIVRKISLNVNKFFTTIFYIEQQYIVHTKYTYILAYETKTNCYFKEKAHILE